MRRLVLSFAVALALGGGVAFAQSSPSPAPAPAMASAAAVPAPTPAASPAAVVHVKNFAYVPDTVTIHPGQTVTFVEDDDTPHTVTGSGFDSGNLDKGATWSYAFTKEGTYAYICAYHPYMKGRIIVKVP